MRKSFLGLIALLFLGVSLQAQDAAAGLKEAKKFMSKYEIETDSDKRAEFLETARVGIDQASAGLSSFEAKDLYKLWALRGNIYNMIAKTDINASFLDNTHTAKIPEASSLAYEAYQKSLEVSEKKWQKSGAIEALLETANSMANAGRMMYGNKNYKGALSIFEKALEAKSLLSANGEEKFLATDEEMNEHLFATALSASISKNKEATKKYFGKLYDAGYDNAGVYDGYFRALKDSDETKALEVLAKGREIYPEDEQLLIAEINYYLQAQKLDVLVDRLKTAIEKDPTNTTYVSTLGNVYDNLSVKAAEEGDAAKSTEYFDNALKYYNKALELDPKYHTALYNIGTLYYNKAAVSTKEMIALSSDYSKEGTAKYKAKEKEVFEKFDLALPYFEKAEALDANDIGTLIALKEIYAKKNELDKSMDFKKRLETVEAGGKNESFHKM